MMADTIDLPQIGPVQKKTVYVIGAAAGGIVAYAWWRSRGASDEGDTAEPEPEDPYGGLTDSGGAMGGVSGYDATGATDAAQTGPRTNAEWSAKVRELLAGSYDITAIDDALGRYLARRALTDLDQRIIQAGIAVAGYPPVGNFTVVPGGNSDITVAPGGLRVVPGPDKATVSWNPVPGAGGYLLSRSDTGAAAPSAVGGTTMTMYNLDPGRQYKVAVAAVSSGKRGPWSGQITFTTPAPKLKAPGALRAIKIERTQVTVSYSAVPGARGYVGFRSGVYVGAAQSQDTRMTIGGMKPGTRYTLSVAARTGVGNAVGPKASIAVTTRK